MSASEHLRALDEAITDLSPFKDGRFVSEIHVKEPAAQSLVALRNVLPQIIAVVEAAERREDFAAPGVARLVADLDEALTVDGKEKERQ